MSTNKPRSGGPLVIGGPAKANLLPPEVGAAAHGKVLRRNAVAIIILAVILVIAGYAGASVITLSAQGRLDGANAHTQELLAEQAKFTEVRSVKSLLQTAVAARIAATSTEVDWKDYLDQIQAILPAGTLVTNVSAEVATPLAPYSQPSVPLQGDRIGQLTFTATSASLPDVEKWLQSLATLPGYVDAAPGTVNATGDGSYQVSITLHINKGVLLLRFDDELRDARDEAQAEEDAKNEVTSTPSPSPSPETPDEAEGGADNE